MPEDRVYFVAAKCGPDEIFEVFTTLQQLEREKEELPEWDGDSSDDIWRAQVTFSKILSGVPNQYLSVVAEGLKNQSNAVRFYTALAFKNRKDAVAKLWLQAALAVEDKDLNRRILLEAIDACSMNQGFLRMLSIFRR